MLSKTGLIKESLLHGRNTGCMLIHGYTTTPDEINELSNMLNNEGYTVLSITLPRVGNKQASYHDWIKSVEDGYETLRKTCRRIYFVGHSVGALLAMYMAEKYVFTKLVVISPPLFMKNKSINFAFLLKLFKKYESLTPEKHDEKIALESLDQFNMLKSIVKLNMKKIEEPILVVYSEKDNIVDEKSVRFIEGNTSSKEVKKLYLKESTHGVIDISEKALISNEVLSFLSI